LSEGDNVIVFHGLNSGAISFDLHLQIFASLASFEYIRTQRSAKNYLDFQLATYLGYQVATTNASEFVIVSKDAGFDSVIDFWSKKMGRMTFRRQTTVGVPIPSTSKVIKPGGIASSVGSVSTTATETSGTTDVTTPIAATPVQAKPAPRGRQPGKRLATVPAATPVASQSSAPLTTVATPAVATPVAAPNPDSGLKIMYSSVPITAANTPVTNAAAAPSAQATKPALPQAKKGLRGGARKKTDAAIVPSSDSAKPVAAASVSPAKDKATASTRQKVNAPAAKPVAASVVAAAPVKRGPGRPRKFPVADVSGKPAVQAAAPVVKQSAPAAKPTVSTAKPTAAAPAKKDGGDRLPQQYRERITLNLKGYKLQVNAYRVIYSLMYRHNDLVEFRTALAKAFPGKDAEIFDLISETFHTYRSSLADPV
jgi:hypothetical protein